MGSNWIKEVIILINLHLHFNQFKNLYWSFESLWGFLCSYFFLSCASHEAPNNEYYDLNNHLLLFCADNVIWDLIIQRNHCKCIALSTCMSCHNLYSVWVELRNSKRERIFEIVSATHHYDDIWKNTCFFPLFPSTPPFFVLFTTTERTNHCWNMGFCDTLCIFLPVQWIVKHTVCDGFLFFFIYIFLLFHTFCYV